MTQRTDQLASVIHHEVQSVLTRGLNDPRVRGLISITKVEVTPDLAEAKVHVSILPEHHTSLTMLGLRHATGHIQSRVAKVVTSRRMPRLRFVLDESLKKQARLESAIAQARPANSEPGDQTQDTVRFDRDLEEPRP